jgi:hypothetical protein
MRLRLGLSGLLLLLAAAGAAADRGACISALGALGPAKLDAATRDAWTGCPCEATARSTSKAARRDFCDCIKRTAAQAVRGGALPPPCYAEVVHSARHSTCGSHAGDAVTCCLRDGCTIAGSSPAGTRNAEMLCSDRGGRAGASPSCYDACPPSGEAVCSGTEDIDAAYKRAERTIATALGVSFDPTNPKHAGWLMLQGPHELGCFVAGTVTKDFGPR